MDLYSDYTDGLIDNSTPFTPGLLDFIATLPGQQISVLKLKFSKDFLKLLKANNVKAIKFSNSSIRVDENGVTIETYVSEQLFYPKEAREAFAAINQVMQRSIHYENVEGLDCLRQEPRNSHPKCLNDQEMNKYIRAAEYLPDLLRENGKILVKPEQQQRFAEFRRKYRIQAQWIEYYILDNSNLTTAPGFKRPTERQYKPGKISAMRHGLIQGMWFEAERKNRAICQWILSFDCPSQVWLALEAILVIKQWNRDNSPKNRYQFYQSEQRTLNRLREYKGIKVTLLYSDNKDENKLSLEEAFSFTLIRLLELGVELPQYQAYLDARTAQANQLRKGEQGERSNRGSSTSR